LNRVDLGTRFLDARLGDRVLRVRIERPERRNAITQDMYRGLKRASILADGDPEVDALCITGSGDVFAVGGDMSGTSEDPEGLAQELDPTDHFPFRHLARCRKIVVAAVNGICFAGGLNLVLYADVALASERARFRAPELLRGTPDPWMAARLPHFVGEGAARYLLFTAAELDAREAAALGLVGKVVAHEAFEAQVEWTLEQIRLTAPRARALVKNDLNRRLPAPDVNLFRSSLLSPEMVEGMRAFLEKRRPAWPREGT
jgi:enoyl-CoA hydratase/carnithine racemase